MILPILRSFSGRLLSTILFLGLFLLIAIILFLKTCYEGRSHIFWLQNWKLQIRIFMLLKWNDALFWSILISFWYISLRSINLSLKTVIISILEILDLHLRNAKMEKNIYFHLELKLYTSHKTLRLVICVGK